MNARPTLAARLGKPLEHMTWPELARAASYIEQDANELAAELETRKRFMSEDSPYQRAHLVVTNDFIDKGLKLGAGSDGKLLGLADDCPEVICRILVYGEQPKRPAEARS